MSMRRFAGKKVLVTGAAAGIGRATALRLAEEGARLAIADRDTEGLEETAGRIAEAGGTDCHRATYDAADGDASARMAAGACETLGGLDRLICNAGIYRRAHFTDISPADWTAMLDINLTSVARIIQAALPALRESRGNVVSVASTAAIHGIAYAAHYAAAKAGIVALTRSLAVEYAPAGIRFNAVAPGKVRTGIGVGLAPLEDQDQSLLVRPPKLAGALDGGEPETLAATIAFLASDDARYVSGSLLVADGAQNIG